MAIEKIILQSKSQSAQFGGADTYTDVVTTGGLVDTERAEYDTGDVQGVREIVKIVCNWLEPFTEPVSMDPNAPTKLDTITHASFRGNPYQVVGFSRPDNFKITFTLSRSV